MYSRIKVSKTVLRNAFYNILGLGIPAVVALFAIPQLIHGLGTEKFGILTIIWAFVSYFGIFDLGLGRAVTKHMATALTAGDDVAANKVTGTGSVAMLFLGLIGGAAMAALTPVLSSKFASPSDVGEVSLAFYWMAAAIPFVIMTSCYRGILEATHRFALINAIRAPMGIFTFLAPVIVVAYAGPRLDTIALVLAVGRILACGLHAVFALKAIPGHNGHGIFDRDSMNALLRTGGWLTVSNVVAPLMNYIDRFILGIVASGAAVAFYVAPQELILRIGLIPSALATVLFPIFASASVANGIQDTKGYVRNYSALVALVMAPLALILFLFADEILTLWIDEDFAAVAGPILQVMAAASLVSGVAQIPFTMLQGRGRADITGKLHLAEFPLYLLVLFAFVYFYGPLGAAFAWLIRIAADAGLLFFFNGRVSKDSSLTQSPAGANGLSRKAIETEESC